MVFPIRRPWTKVACLVSAGRDLEAREASVEPAIAPTLLRLQVSASVLLEDFCPVKLLATGTGPTERAAHISRQHGAQTTMQLDPPHIDTTRCAYSAPVVLKVCPQ